MTNIVTGSSTILAQTAREMMGLPQDEVSVKLGNSAFPVAPGSAGQFGASNSTAGVYTAGIKLREAIAQRLGVNSAEAVFASGRIRSGNRSSTLHEAAAAGELIAEDKIEYGDLAKIYQLSTFGSHFVEVCINAYTGLTRIRRMSAMCAAGRIIVPKSARCQVIGAMTMRVRSVLIEELSVNKRFGFFVNDDLASYKLPVHADIPYQEVVFLLESTTRPTL